MLVDINLLPQHEKKNQIWLYIVFGVLSFGILSIILLSILVSTLGKEVDTLSEQLEMSKQLRVEKEQSIADFESSDAWLQLESAVKWAESYPIATVPILNHLVELLPKRGFINQFTYTENGTIGLSIQFDTSREAAYYLTHLKESEYIMDAKLLSVATVPVQENERLTVSNTEQVLPRYVSQFELTLNRSAVIELGFESRENSEEQGGDSE
ncbi:hypothetical protein HF072_13890 [Bacillus sp. RO3]|nr:hypothetical protein [Bacillus sp. RO3]